MASYRAYRLYFTTPVHFGNSRKEYDVSQRTLHSDSLYAALTAALGKMGVDIPAGGDLGCAVSSLFPFYQRGNNDSPVYFLPKPLYGSDYGISNLDQRKKIKKVEWLDIPTFERAIKGENLFENAKVLDAVQDRYLSSKVINPNFIADAGQQRVTISRSNQENATPFYMDRIAFADHSGLFFIASGDTTLVDRALEVLQYDGLGTDRNVGNGKFEYTDDTIDIDLPTAATCQMSLSTYMPADSAELKEMLQGECVAYHMMRRGGWVTTYPHTPKRKGYAYAFGYGSVFAPYKSAEIKGKIIDLSLGVPDIDHPIYRSGRALFIPIKA